ncbi:MAG: amino acid permease [Polyangiaceae bacterium]|nr:amino acid permease [Polyangiaceae bacterium]
MTTTPSESPPDLIAKGLRRRLNLFDVLCIGVNAIVGSGVFALPDDMQRSMGGWSPLAFLLCAVLLMPVALCFAELAGRHDDTGGSYLYARNAFGPRVGFFVGWYCWANTFVSWAANMTLFVELVGFRDVPVNKIVAIAGIVALGAINYFGVKPGAWVVNLVVIGKLSAIFCFLAVAILAFDPSKLGGPLPYGVAGVGQGIYLALFPLQGFEVTPITAGETKNPQRTVPLGTLGALLFSALLFVLVQATLATTYPGIANESQRPLADGARYLGPTLGAVVLIGSMVSIGGFTAGSALGSPRYAQAIAAHRLLPAPIASLHPKWATPHIAILLTTAFTACLAAFLDYRQLVGMSNITIVVQYLFTCLAVPAIRKKQGPAPAKAFVIPFGPVIPLIGAAGSITFLYGPVGGLLRLESESILEVVFALGTLILGVVVAAVYARRRQGEGGP